MPEHSRPTVGTHMLQEIQEQPTALHRTLSETVESVRRVALEAQQRDVDRPWSTLCSLSGSS
jgi:fructoselysine-6-P-deglycase FrlB-like protein